ncbi:diaminopimelate epimerase [Caldisericum exile]|uniref:Diaminopimelate epimerase n=1 Tax=Caldisericum exile (strain DSM 21853 / NBRC 104410 / AZM16c01) TaxID=511051 RepID=A0A7U6GEE9_CALEA|nr:diaminopimelate epimerase [Caldisericum exile]BAL80874.1 diaminopimelate epimerase [Caldisericum exile AZM16c01]
MSKGKILEFYKFEGALNDFVIIDGRSNKLEYPLEVARMLLDRHASIGGDSLLYLEESNVADIKMRVLEKDGSESQMCGNGARCVGLYFDKFFGKRSIKIETLSGLKEVKKVADGRFVVSMGPVQKLGNFVIGFKEDYQTTLDLFSLKLYIVNSSEPHAVIPMMNINKIPKAKGVKIAKNFKLFPYGINVDFIEIVNKNTIKIRTIERGVYEETLACGTGAVASAYVLHEFFGGNNVISVKALGGDLTVIIKESENLLEGDARFVFKGEIEL